MVKQHRANPEGQRNLILIFLDGGKNVSENFVLAAVGVDQTTFPVSTDGSGNKTIAFDDTLNVSWISIVFKTVSLLVLFRFITLLLAVEISFVRNVEDQI